MFVLLNILRLGRLKVTKSCLLLVSCIGKEMVRFLLARSAFNLVLDIVYIFHNKRLYNVLKEVKLQIEQLFIINNYNIFNIIFL